MTPKITRHQKAFKTLARVNTVSLLLNTKNITNSKIESILLIAFHPFHFSGAPVYISNPHFYLADPELLNAVEGLTPNQSLHESYFKIQPVSTN